MAKRATIHRMNPDLIHVRPDVSLVSILGYALFAFAAGLILTPGFVTFLRRNRLGKQLRVETVDGREASIFRKFHEKKFGTPTMGGILIWGSMVLTILFSRVLSYFDIVENSLLQRGEVYIPLFMLLSLGVLGAIDDYLNVVGTNEEQWKKMLPRIRIFFASITVLSVLVGIYLFLSGKLMYMLTTPNVAISPVVVLSIYVVSLAYLGAMVVVLDDFSKKHTRDQRKKGGLAVLPKITSLILISLVGALWFYFKLDYNSVYVPFYGEVPIGMLYIPMFIFIIVGTANAVNVTDGLDGLAGGLLVIAFGAFGILAYLSGLTVLAAFCAVAAAAVAAFLWHNVPPALFYMGDTGALALGGTLGAIALMTDQVLVLPFLGFVFVIEMLSVIIQLTSKKLRGGKKVFLAAPIHHHFEALEWGESKVTMRLWIVGALFALIGIILGLQAVNERNAERATTGRVTMEAGTI